MSGRLQQTAWLRQWRRDGQPTEWQNQFAYLGRGNKLTCLVCGRKGYQSSIAPSPWQVGCLIGHRQQCPQCNAPVHNLGSHLGCRKRHGSCAQHDRTQYRTLKEQR